MRVRTSLILDEALMAKIDELAKEKHRRSAVVETALKEYIAREERKLRSNPAPATELKTAKEKAAAGRR